MAIAKAARLPTNYAKYPLLRALAGVAALVLGCTIATPSWAQSEAGTSVDTARGTVTGSTRRIGLGGAFVAIAEDTEGVAINPASTAVRLPYSWQAFDYGFGIDIAVGAWLPKNDIYNQEGSDVDNDGEADEVKQSTALFGSLAAIVNYRHAGLGISAEAQRNAASSEDQAQGVTTDLSANFGMVHLNLAYGFLDGQLLFGAGPRVIGMSFDSGSGSSVFGSAGVGYEAGVVIKPTVAPFRIAAAVKSPIDAEAPGSTEAVKNTVHVPWEAAFGFAYQFGKRQLNPSFHTASELARQYARGGEPSEADIERAEKQLLKSYLQRQRWYLLLSAELSLIEGGGKVGLSNVEADDRAIISPRLGAESEVIPHHLRLRAGTYYEPALATDAKSRIHATGGFDVKLFEWSVFGLIDPFDYWQLSVAADGARSYLNTSFSIGFWH